MYEKKLTVIILTAAFLLTSFLSAPCSEITADTLKTAVAQRANHNIRIDGILNEIDWKTALPISGFRQLQPTEGEMATESTLVKIIYDDEAIYVGFWCYDSEPEKISAILTRRDRWSESDQVSVRFDSRHDHQTAYYFAVSAAGVMRDILLYNNNSGEDESWDVIWEANSKVTDWGWMAEFKIPFSTLRFTHSAKYIWGLDMSRYLPRNHENVRWQFVPSSESQGVARYGHLVGLEGVEPANRMETLPYLVSYNVSEPKSLGNPDGNELIADIGVDLKYGISSAFTLDATVNPDFGQVESDRSVLNLSAYETFYEEKRPFFLEGVDIFDTRFFTPFYSRRIGRPPTGGVDSAEYYIDYPRNTTILNAVKVSGKTEGGTSIGFLNATTQEEKTRYRIEDSDEIYEAVVEPLANYIVARAKQDIWGKSYIGGMFTSANQKDRTDAYSGSVDWKICLPDDKFQWDGTVISTYNGPGTKGVALATSIGKHSGKNIRGNIFFDYYDREVNWNRLGYLGDNDYFGSSFWIQFRSNKEFSIFRHMNINFNGWYNENLDGYRYGNGGNYNGSIGFTNHWWIWTGLGLNGDSYNSRETRDGGLWKRDNGPDFWIGGNTNQANPVWLELHYNRGTTRNGLYNGYSTYINYRPVSNFELSVGTNYEIYQDMNFWVGCGADDDLPVFGELDNDVMDITLRSTYTFTRNMTLQLYTQFYFSAGEYDNYKKLTSPEQLDSIDTAVYNIDFSRGDFNNKSLNINLIFRWEYRPGSTLYLVWTQVRNRYDINRENYNYAYNFSRDFDDLWDLPQTNTFLVKANYWWNI